MVHMQTCGSYGSRGHGGGGPHKHAALLLPSPPFAATHATQGRTAGAPRCSNSRQKMLDGSSSKWPSCSSAWFAQGAGLLGGLQAPAGALSGNPWVMRMLQGSGQHSAAGADWPPLPWPAQDGAARIRTLRTKSPLAHVHAPGCWAASRPCRPQGPAGRLHRCRSSASPPHQRPRLRGVQCGVVSGVLGVPIAAVRQPVARTQQQAPAIRPPTASQRAAQPQALGSCRAALPTHRAGPAGRRACDGPGLC